MLYRINSLRFENTICNASPCIIESKFDLNTILTHCNVWKCLWMWVEVNLKFRIFFSNDVQYFTNTVFKLSRGLE